MAFQAKRIDGIGKKIAKKIDGFLSATACDTVGSNTHGSNKYFPHRDEHRSTE